MDHNDAEQYGQGSGQAAEDRRIGQQDEESGKETVWMRALVKKEFC